MANERVNHPPPPDPWTTAIYLGKSGTIVRGTGVVVSGTKILTAAHVVRTKGSWLDDIWVAFPKANLSGKHAQRQRVVAFHPYPFADNEDPDLAVLELETPVPQKVSPARLRFPLAADLFDKSWWVFGFPGGAPHGAAASGRIDINLANGLIGLNAESVAKLEGGFSGSGIWSKDYDAVVGIVVNAAAGGIHVGDGHALTIHFADMELPDLKLRLLHAWTLEAAGADSHAAWGWSLVTDDERGRHWSPRARGVATDSDRGYHFRGRTEALNDLVTWLDRSGRDQRLLVVTGSPGVGKSAVLGRLVTTADATIRGLLPSDDVAVRATPGSVDCAVHVKGKTALEAATEIARAASARIPTTPDEVVGCLQESLARRPSRFNVVVDALDEAASPAQARLLVKLLLNLVGTCHHLGAQVIIGTRRTDDGGDLLAEFNGGAAIIDLDDQRYFAEQDLAAYARSTLQLIGAERPNNPYQDDAVAEPVARRIGHLADRNFLVAGLVARSHGLYDTVAVEPDALTFAGTVDESLNAYVGRLPAAGASDGRLALTVLAYAQAAGLPASLWQAGVAALGGGVTAEQLSEFARTSAANFLIEAGAAPAYRLFHKALNEALLRDRQAAGQADEDARRIFDAFYHHGRTQNWEQSEYLLRWLPLHAARAGRVDDLLADDDYLLRADLVRLMTAAEGASTDVGRARATLLRRTLQAVDTEPAERASMFSVTQAMDQLDTSVVLPTTAPYAATWASTPPRVELAVLEGHTDAVLDVCQVPVNGRSLLASAGQDGTVRLWDPLTGQTQHILEHRNRVRAVCAIILDDRTLVAAAVENGTIALWDAETGNFERSLKGHTDWIRALCTIRFDGRMILVSASDDRTLQLWDPQTGDGVWFIGGQPGWITAACVVPNGTAAWLVWASYTGTITVWDGLTERLLTGHTSWVTSLTAVSIDDTWMLASCGYDGTVLLWDVENGQSTVVASHPDRPVTGICSVRYRDRMLLASTIEDGTVRIWDPSPNNPLMDHTFKGHSGWAIGVCSINLGNREMVASASEDGTVRLWDPDTGTFDLVPTGDRTGPVEALCGVQVAGRNLVAATAVDGAVRLWDVATGELTRTLNEHHEPVVDVCTVTVAWQELLVSAGQDGKIRLHDLEGGYVARQLQRGGDWVAAVCAVSYDDGYNIIATAGDDQAVRLWNPQTGELRQELFGHTEWVRALCVVDSGERQLLASASHDGTTRLWNPKDGSLRRVLTGHHAAVTALCDVPLAGRRLLATGSDDYTVRLWNPETGEPEAVLEGHRAEVTAVCAVNVGGETLVASASRDRTVRLWDPVTGGLRRTIPVHSGALSIRQIAGRLIIGLTNGLLAIELRGTPNRLAAAELSNLRG